ncbi:SusC/RagA family TonB-linked outer membrane protein [Empedobacter sp. ULE_I140]
MRKKLTSLSLLAFLGLSTAVFAQTKGTVNDANGFPEADIEVSVKGTDKVAYTDENGNFDIDAKIGDTLIIDGKEYIVSKNDLGVLKPSKSEIVDLEETVVTAYGSQKRETIVGSNTQINSDKFEDRPLTNIGKALEGASSGVQFSTTSGQPGNSTNIRIRGFSSYNLSNAPLYVVDGAIFTGSLSDINPNDIESLNILKDAASTSLYGASAANGVVMITTKKGRKGKKGNFTFTSNTGVVTRAYKDYETVGPEDYYRLTWTAMRNGYMESNPNVTEQQANDYASKNLITGTLKNNIYNVPDDQVIINGQLNPLAKKLYDDFNWQDYVTRVGSIAQYNLSFAGADDKSDYFASIGYNNEKGYVIKSDFERYSARVKANSKVTSWLKLGGDISGSLTKSALADSDGGSSYINPFYIARFMAPIYSPFLYDAQGNKVYDIEGNQKYDGVTTRGRAGGSAGRNVLQETLLNDKYEKTTSVFTRWFAELQLAKGLTLTGNLSYDVQNYYYQSYQNNVVGDGAGKGRLYNQNQRTVGITINQILNYSKSFGKHNFEFLVGHESFIRNVKYNYQGKEGQIIPGILELVNFTTSTSNTGYTWDLSKESFFGRVNYDYNRLYSVSASIRQDESSRFSPDKNKGIFWSAGAAWNIGNESFLQNTFVNSLKLRSSYGEVGNDGGLGSTPGYQADLSLYGLGWNNGSEPGVMLSQIGNPALTWETNKQFDVGVDFGLFNNRISGSIEYYNRKSDQMIFSVPTPGSAGVPGNSIDRNLGTMQNKGIEVSLNFGIVRSDNVKWDLGVNASTIENTMVKMPGDQQEIINGTKKITKGRSIYDFWLRKFYGVDSDTGRSLYYQDPTKGDDGNTKTINGQKFTYNHVNAEYDYVASAIPDLYGSFTTNLEVKGFYLNALFTYQIGGKTYDGNYTGFVSLNPNGTALHKDMLNAWTKPGDVTSVNKFSTNNTTQNLAASSRWLVDSDYLAFRTLTFGYNFKKSMIESLGLSSLKMYISGENIAAWTARTGLEAVQSFNGTTTYRYLPSRTVSVGLNVQF